MIKPVAVEVNFDKPRSLIFTKRSRLVVEREINRYRGAGPQQWSAWSDLCSNLSLDTTYAILWAAMLHEEPALKFEDAMSFLSEAEDRLVTDTVLEIFAKQFPQKAEAESGNGADPTKPSSTNQPLQ